MAMTTADSGPVLSSWLLSNQLLTLRRRAGLNQAEVARELGKHEKTIGRWELGNVIPGKLELRFLCELYQVPDEAREELEGLRQSANKPGWWNGAGERPETTYALLNMEMVAVRFRAFDLTAVPGLLQTPEVARLIIQAVEPEISPRQLDADVELRMARQQKVFGGPARQMTFMIDELAFARMPGTSSIRRAQLARLLSPPRQVTIQVVPFGSPHPALGSFTIFDFDSDVIPAGVFVGGSLRTKGTVETGDEIERYDRLWAWLQVKALTPRDTREFLEHKLERVTDD